MLKFRWETEFRETEIGEIPKDWEVMKVNSIARVNEENINKNYPHKIIEYIDINSVEEGIILEKKLIPLESAPSRAKRVVKDKDILLSTVRPNLRHYAFIKKANSNTVASTGFAVIRSKNIEPRFLYFFLTTDYVTEFLTQIAEENASTYPAFTVDILENLSVAYPPPEEQTRIATVLSWFDDLIENKRRQNEILEKTAMAIFKSWFIDFEPFQDEEFVYSEELDMEMPEGWDVKPIGEAAEFTNGLSYKGSEKFSEYVDGAYVFITLNNINEGGGFKPEYAWIKSTRLKQRHFLKEGDLIFANTEQTKSGRLLGSPAFVIFPPEYGKDKGVYSHHITKVMPFSEEIKEYLYLIFRTYQKVIANTYHTGTGVWGFDLRNFKENYYIPVPPQPILERFHSLVEPLFQKILINEKEIMLLKKVRDTLLPQLVFGRLRVEEL
ncbi:restriction endonuclease subunit S [Thermococcus stetteri]|uniref:restriction endonuclease subunit S n=1 Tax=Thermococcus stetteri TaxID=49900 RepID=UPI001AE33213|nr:restriction endonuclease subunit S [Thermococcus stetteri]